MSGRYERIVVGIVAVLMLRISLSDDFLIYVRPAMRPLLVVAGAALVVVAGAPSVARRQSAHDAHGGSHTPRVAWLLLLPVAAVFVVVPEPLGLFAASRGSSWTPQVSQSDPGWPPPLPSPVNGAHELGLNEFNVRAYFDEARGLEGKPVRLIGFVRRDSNTADGEFLLTRFLIRCCAADGIPMSVRITGLDEPPPPDETWVEVRGTWLPSAPDLDWQVGGENRNWASLIAETVRPIPPPREPYESSTL